MNRLVMGTAVVGVLVLGLAAAGYAPYHTQTQPQAAAASVKTQASTAATHAGFAASGTTMAYVQQHLGHALNCLEGKQGKNFNASWGNVCEGQGNGILTDLKASGGAALMPVAESADALAVQGLKSSDLSQAKFSAQGVASLLKIVADNAK